MNPLINILIIVFVSVSISLITFSILQRYETRQTPIQPEQEVQPVTEHEEIVTDPIPEPEVDPAPQVKIVRQPISQQDLENIKEQVRLETKIEALKNQIETAEEIQNQDIYDPHSEWSAKKCHDLDQEWDEIKERTLLKESQWREPEIDYESCDAIEVYDRDDWRRAKRCYDRYDKRVDKYNENVKKLNDLKEENNRIFARFQLYCARFITEWINNDGYHTHIPPELLE